MLNYQLFYFLSFVLILLAAGIYLEANRASEVADQPVVESNGFCLIEKVPYGQNYAFAESKPGQYDYQVYSTNDGYEVWGKCK
jgi:hypothetical protein